MNALNNTKTSDILDITFEGGESLNNPGKAADYMIVRRDRDELYAERLVEDRWDVTDDFDHYDDLLADIIFQAEEEGMNFNAVKVNGKAVQVVARFNIPTVYADYFDDADVCAESVAELGDKLEKMQDVADDKMADAWRAGTLSISEYYNAPTYASLAQTEWAAL